MASPSYAEPIPIPQWLESLPEAPVYRPSLSDFADPIAFISRIEHHASLFGICKVIPPLPKLPKSSVLLHLHSSLLTSFTTRVQELASKKPSKTKNFWQSGEFYTLDQFEAKSKSFSRSQLHGLKDTSPLHVEALFWHAVAEKPISVEYANDVPGSAFAPPRRRKRKREEAAVVRSLSDSPWNLQVIARSPGSLTRFIPDDIPGVTSPMLYIGMLFSWFAWHVEDHELHSMNFLHMGAPKTWYAVPGKYAASLEEVVRVQGYGGNVDRLAAFMTLGEKTTLLSPEVLVQAGIPCCRLVQYPGEFVVTFPRAYHEGFSHGFNCGEAANFATPQWLKVAKEAAVRRAAMNHLPMVSHQQLLYMLTTSFISRVPRAMLPGVQSSRLRDREKERELLIKKAFLNDMMDENHKLHILLEQESISSVLLWEPELLPSSNGSQSNLASLSLEAPCTEVVDECQREAISSDPNVWSMSDIGPKNCCEENRLQEETCNLASMPFPNISASRTEREACHAGCLDSNVQTIEQSDDEDEDELPFGLNVDSGTLACVACGILGYPFMAIVDPSEIASTDLCAPNHEDYHKKPEKSDWPNQFLPASVSATAKFCSVVNEANLGLVEQPKQELNSNSSRLFGHASATEGHSSVCNSKFLKHDIWASSSEVTMLPKVFGGKSSNETSDRFIRPRIFCLQHTIEIIQLLHGKGGVKVSIICHTDYLKIKALAIAVAEEICMQFNFKDFPIMDASPADLDLINASIDDDGHEDDSEDWTVKMGINLRYFVNVRKQLSSNMGLLPLSLRGIFSDPSPLAVVSNLKWHSRKARTPYKVVGTVQSKPHTDMDVDKDMLVMKKSRAASVEVIEVCQSCKLSSSDSGCIDDVGITCSQSLVTVPVLAAESFHMHPVFRSEKMNSSLAVCDSLESERSIVHDMSAVEDCEGHLVVNTDKEAISLVGCISLESYCSKFCLNSGNSEIHQSEDEGDLANSGCKICASDNPESQVNIVVREVELSEMQKEIRAVDIHSPHKLDRTLSSHSEPTPETHVDAGEHLHRGMVASLIFSANSDENLEVSALEELKYAEVDISLEPNTSGSITNDSQPKQYISNARENNIQLKNDSMHLGGQLVLDTMTIDGTEMRQKVHFATSAEVCSVESEGHLFTEPATETSESLLEASNSTYDNGNFVMGSSLDPGKNVCAVENSVVQEVNQNTGAVNSILENGCLQSGLVSDSARPIIVYRRAGKSKKKQKRDAKLIAKQDCSFNEFVRSPCEGLRPRTGHTAIGTASLRPAEKVADKVMPKEDFPGKRIKHKTGGTFECEIEGCCISFWTKRELDRHLDNQCTFKGCGKKFSSHVSAMHHQRAHEEERPFKCPWRGCNMSFKWAWAKTEHVRLHTGERPYKCKVAGCGMTFRFVSDFSRHRRKTGHYEKSGT